MDAGVRDYGGKSCSRSEENVEIPRYLGGFLASPQVLSLGVGKMARVLRGSEWRGSVGGCRARPQLYSGFLDRSSW